MTVEISPWLLSFAVVAAFLAMPAACWWTWYLSRKVGQTNIELVQTVRESCQSAIKTAVDAANVTAVCTKGILESTKPLVEVIQQMGGVVINRDPTNVMERMFNRLSVAGPDANGRASYPVPNTTAAAAQPQPDPTKKPRGVRLPSEM